MMCEECSTRHSWIQVLGRTKHGFPRPHTVSRESDRAWAAQRTKSILFVEPINTRGLGTRVLRKLSRPGDGHETGFCTFDVLHALMREAHARRPDRVSLTDGAKIKADAATKDLQN